jgi:hypothetical protein
MTIVRPHLFCGLSPDAQPVLHAIEIQDHVLRRAAIGKGVISVEGKLQICMRSSEYKDSRVIDDARSKILYVFAVPLAARISSNNTIKWQSLHAQALQTQPDNHNGEKMR